MNPHNSVFRSVAAIALVVGVVGALAIVGVPAVNSQSSGVTTPTPSDGADDPYDCDDFENADQVRAVFADEAPEDESNLDDDDDNIPCEGDFEDQSGPVTTTPASTPTDTATTTTEEVNGGGPGERNVSVTFENQTSDGTTVVVDSVMLSTDGFVAVHNASLSDGDVLNSVIGVSDHLSAGIHENVEITLFDVPGQDFTDEMSLEADQELTAMVHVDTNSNEVYDFVTSEGGEDYVPSTGDNSGVGSAYVTPEEDTSTETQQETSTETQEDTSTETQENSSAGNSGNGKAKSGDGTQASSGGNGKAKSGSGSRA